MKNPFVPFKLSRRFTKTSFIRKSPNWTKLYSSFGFWNLIFEFNSLSSSMGDGGLRGQQHRGSSSLEPSSAPEHQTFTAARRPSSAIDPSSEGGSALVEKASWEVDDWEFVGVEDGLSLLPRVVFGGALIFDEVKEATLELTTATETTLMFEFSNFPLLMATENLESITCTSCERTSTHVVRKHVVHVFRFLSEIPVAQRRDSQIGYRSLIDGLNFIHKVRRPQHRRGRLTPRQREICRRNPDNPHCHNGKWVTKHRQQELWDGNEEVCSELDHHFYTPPLLHSRIRTISIWTPASGDTPRQREICRRDPDNPLCHGGK
uniref:Uncharacterized protein n=1 Tax=Kalanchoe fedtschenkoi TaxID=63787 RepID=A0A7N0RDX7_KALFE